MEELRELPPRIDFRFSAERFESTQWWEAFDDLDYRSDFDLEFLGSTGEIVGSVEIREFLIYTSEEVATFSSAFWSDAVDFASFRVVRGSEVIAEESRPPRPLSVEMIEPSAGAVLGGADRRLEIVWRSCGGPLEHSGGALTDAGFDYLIAHSVDGGETYTPMKSMRQQGAVPLLESHQGLYRSTTLWGMWPQFSGGSDRARVRLRVTSGARWAQVESPVFVVEAPTEAPFPSMTVLEPRNGEIFEHGAMIELKARLAGFGALSGRSRLDSSSDGTDRVGERDDSELAGRVSVTWHRKRPNGSDELALPLAAMEPLGASAYNGVYTWHLDTAELKRGVNELTATAADDGLEAWARVEVVVLAPDDAPTAVYDEAQWQTTPFGIDSGMSRAGPDDDAPLIVRALRNDIVGDHPLDPETLRVVEQPHVGSAKVVLPPRRCTTTTARSTSNSMKRWAHRITARRTCHRCGTKNSATREAPGRSWICTSTTRSSSTPRGATTANESSPTRSPMRSATPSPSPHAHKPTSQSCFALPSSGWTDDANRPAPATPRGLLRLERTSSRGPSVAVEDFPEQAASAGRL